MSTVISGGTPIYYETKGEGTAIVFAHGAGGNAAIWFNQVAHFSPDHQVIAFDHRGFGRTPVPDEQLSARWFRDDLLAILDAEEIEQAHIVGQSMGGFTVLRTALDAPDRVLSLTMSATHGGIANPNPTPAMKALVSSSDSDISGVSNTMSKASKRRPELMQLYESINNFNINFRWSNLTHLLGPKNTLQLEDLAAVKCPTLFICGEEDPLFPPELLASYIPHFGNAQLEVVENAGHSPYFEQPDRFNALLKQHLDRATHS
ncbi:MAG: alpha/beta fold hydrolase [Pseudomonadales bacterium]